MALVVPALAWLMAIAAVALWQAPAWMVSAWLLAALPAVAVRRGRYWALLVACAAVLALAGGLRYEHWRTRAAPDLAASVGATVTLEGVVASEPDPGLTTVAYRVNVARVDDGSGWRPTSGAVRATFQQYESLRRGTRVSLEGALARPPLFEDFDYRGYLARQGVVATMLYPRVEVVDEPGTWDPRTRLGDLRLRLERALERSLPEPEASLGAGIAFGRDENLPRDLYDDFRAAGLAHLVAVSGSNVSLVAAMGFFLLVPLVGRRLAIAPAAIAVLGYVLVAGFSASVVRAGVMAGVFLLGAALGRQESSLAALGAAAIVMTAVQPGAAADVGFQLSLAATAGLIAFEPWIRHGLQAALARARLAGVVPGLLVQAAALSLSASLATLPLVWVNFGQVSLVAPLTNVVAEPVFALAFALTGLAALAGAAWAPAGWAIGLVAYYPLAFLTWLGRTAAGIPGAAIEVPRWDGSVALVAYLALAAAAWPCYRRLAPSAPAAEARATGRLVRRLGIAGMAGGFALAVVPAAILPARGPGEMEVTALDVGQGDAILVTTPHGHRYLVDGGPSGIGLARELGAVLPYWERGLDGVFLTHPQEDHLAGLPEVFRRFDVETVYDTGDRATTAAYREYRRRAPASRPLQRGDSVESDGVRFEVLWPPAGYEPANANDRALVLRITYRSTVVLLASDFEAPAQRQLMAEAAVSANVLNVPHHGSRTTAPEFLAAVHPQVAVISVGAGNRFGHPAAETLAALASARLYRTDLQGRVTVASDGRRLSVRTGR